MQRFLYLIPGLLLTLGGPVTAEPVPHRTGQPIQAEAHSEPRPMKKRPALSSRSGRLAPQLPEASPRGRKLTVTSTAYCLRGYTASGTYVNEGTIAVDPRVIPMGTRMYVPGYGYGVARDTGGVIKGNKIDVWFPSLSQCYNWGNRTVTITILDGK